MPDAVPRRQGDPRQLEAFVSGLFRYADPETFVSLRAFDQKDRGTPPIHIEGVRADDMRRLVSRAGRAAEIAANAPKPAVFAPPVATFNNPRTARTADLANGVAISVEVDQGDAQAKLRQLEHLLGPVTLAVASGGEWSDPDTGEVHPKLHLHWRLSEPTRAPEDHRRLQDARWLAAVLVAADRTAAPSAHPLRWPGSWNLKRKPRMARITVGNEASEVHLDDAIEKLQAAVEASGLGKADDGPRVSGEPQAPLPLIGAALAAMPNADVPWDEWVRIGMACWRATGGSEEGLAIWADWSAKSGKHTEEACAERWRHYATSPPQRIGAGTIFHLARLAGWVRPGQAVPDTSEPPPVHDDPGYWRSVEAQLGNLPGAEPPGVEWPEEVRHQDAKGKPEPLWFEDDEWDEAEIPQRRWIAQGYLLRGAVTVVAGLGSAGKSSVAVGWGISLALFRPWSLFVPREQVSVMIYNVEDDAEEQKRRLSATLRQFGATPANLRGRLFRLGPHNVGTLVERDPATGRLTLTDAMAALEVRIAELRPAVLFLDPLVELHTADENDNTALRGIIAYFRTLAVRYDMAVALYHHARKGSAAAAGDPDMIRGAGAIVGACRIALTVATMTEAEAGEAGVPAQERQDYFRVDGAKSNYARLGKGEWFHREVYDLANGEQVAAPVPWKAVSKVAATSTADLNRVLDILKEGFGPHRVPYSASKAGRVNHRWAGWVLVQQCDFTEESAIKLISAWLRNGLLEERKYRDSTEGRDRPGLYVNDAKRPDL